MKSSLGDAVVSGIPSVTYTGYRIKPDPTVTLGGKRLIAGTDYTLSYANNVNAGSDARIILAGIGDYAGSKTVYFEIGPAPITSATPELHPVHLRWHGKEACRDREVWKQGSRRR